MRFATLLVPDDAPAGPMTPQRTGTVDGDDLVDLTDPVIGLPGDMTSLLALGDEAWERAATAAATSARRWGLEQVELLAPVTPPPKVLAIGMNYRAHLPWIVTPDEVGDARSLRIRTWVNGEIRQDATTADLIFGPDEMIEYLTTAFPLEPGDVLLTGTPSGVGAGFRPQRWLKSGDVVRIEIARVGVLENRVVDEPPAAPPPDPVLGG